MMTAISVSPESFYKGSIAATPRKVSAMVRKAIEDDAEIIDIGAMSTAPHLKNEISEETELARLRTALAAMDESPKTVLSVDTPRASVADVALKSGACVINDASGLKHDTRMARVIREHNGSPLAAAHSPTISGAKPIVRVHKALKETLIIAERAGVDEQRIVPDPGIGFFRREGTGPAFPPRS